MYKTPSPVTAKRRISTVSSKAGHPSRKNRVVSEQFSQVKDYSELDRRGSFGNATEILKGIEEDTGSVDSSMGFRELEKVRLIICQTYRSILQRSNDRIFI